MRPAAGCSPRASPCPLPRPEWAPLAAAWPPALGRWPRVSVELVLVRCPLRHRRRATGPSHTVLVSFSLCSHLQHQRPTEAVVAPGSCCATIHWTSHTCMLIGDKIEPWRQGVGPRGKAAMTCSVMKCYSRPMKRREILRDGEIATRRFAPLSACVWPRVGYVQKSIWASYEPAGRL